MDESWVILVLGFVELAVMPAFSFAVLILSIFKSSLIRNFDNFGNDNVLGSSPQHPRQLNIQKRLSQKSSKEL